MDGTRTTGAAWALLFTAFLITQATAQSSAPSVTDEQFPLPIDRAAVAQDWISRGFDCNPYHADRGWASRMHTHDADEVLTVIEGRIGLAYGDQRLAADPGDEMILPADTLHRLENLHDGKSAFLYGLKSTGITIRQTDNCSP